LDNRVLRRDIERLRGGGKAATSGKSLTEKGDTGKLDLPPLPNSSGAETDATSASATDERIKPLVAPDWIDRVFFEKIRQNMSIPEDFKNGMLALESKVRQGFQFTRKIDEYSFKLVVKDGRRILTLPSNINEVWQNTVIANWVIILINSADNISLTGKAVKSFPTLSDSEKSKWLAFTNYLFNPSTRVEKWDYSTADPISTGKTIAKMQIWKAYNKGSNKFDNYLPDCCFVKTAAGRRDILAHHLNALGGIQGLDTIYSGFSELLKLEINKKCEEFVSEGRIPREELKIPFDQAVSDLVRKKKHVIKVKGKSKTSFNILKLVKPSMKVELITYTEKSIFHELDVPWQNLEELQSQWQGGVPLSKLDDIRASYKKSYDQTFIVCDKMNSFLSHRRRNLRALTNIKANAPLVIKPSMLLESFSDCYDDSNKALEVCKNLSSFFPQAYRELPLVGEKLGSMMWTANNFLQPTPSFIDVILRNRFILDQFNELQILTGWNNQIRDDNIRSAEAGNHPISDGDPAPPDFIG